eukprot:COSAG02_NODE_967_length_15586_cov_9.185704_12_plen_300_part_00
MLHPLASSRSSSAQAARERAGRGARVRSSVRRRPVHVAAGSTGSAGGGYSTLDLPRAACTTGSREIRQGSSERTNTLPDMAARMSRRLRALESHIGAAQQPPGHSLETQAAAASAQVGDASQGMTSEQKFFFDLKGYILLPQVLSRAECAEIIAEVDTAGYNIWTSKKALELIDHPAIVPILTELLAEPSFVNNNSYPFRCEGSFTTVRDPGWPVSERGDNGLPHVVRPPQQANAMRYQVAGGKIFSGLTRVVWELTDVVAGQGNTSFLAGSHKAHFNCKSGSAVLASFRAYMYALTGP